jgi:hypothetical protein
VSKASLEIVFFEKERDRKNIRKKEREKGREKERERMLTSRAASINRREHLTEQSSNKFATICCLPSNVANSSVDPLFSCEPRTDTNNLSREIPTSLPTLITIYKRRGKERIKERKKERKK